MSAWNRVSLVLERPLDGHSGAQVRVDFSGARAGVRRPPLSRNSDFPYDAPVTSGQPSSARGDSSNVGLRKYVPDHGGEVPDVDEAMGTPVNFGISGRSNLVQSPPGASGQWAKAPTSDDPEKDVSYEKGHDVLDFKVSVRDPKVATYPEAARVPHHRDQTDDDLENKTNRIWGREDNENFVQERTLGAVDPSRHGEKSEEPVDVRVGEPSVDGQPSAGAPPVNFAFIGKKMSSRGNYGMHGEESMKGLDRLSETLDVLLAEVKKKKEYTSVPRADDYSYSPAFDFSAPLGAYNLYRSQGASNWGPMTGPGTQIDASVSGKRASKRQRNESAWDSARVIAEAVGGGSSR